MVFNAITVLTWSPPIPAFDLGEGGVEYEKGSGTAPGSIPNVAEFRLTTGPLVESCSAGVLSYTENSYVTSGVSEHT